MKRWAILTVLLLSVVLAGCGKQQETVETISATAPTSGESTTAGAVVVQTVDELLEAIGPDREIILEPGIYDLCAAFDYGAVNPREYYFWQECGDGFELKVKGVQNLTIRGSGAEETKLLTTPRYANVLTLQNCSNVILEGFTAGHTDGGDCMGGVVYLAGCLDVKLNQLGLFGCGTTGVRAEVCTDITVSGCDIYECSYTGIHAGQTDGLVVENCKLRNLGEVQYGGGMVFYIDQCSEVSVTGCEVTDNTVSWLFNCYPSNGVEVRNNTFARNRVDASVFSYMEGGLILDGNTFENNNFRSWFQEGDGTVLDGVGKSWTEEMLEREYKTAAEKLPAGERTEVLVATVDELLAAIGPDTEIVLTGKLYDFSTAADYGVGGSEYYYWTEEYDGPNLVITGVNNLTIRSESGDVNKCMVSAVPRYANVFTFRGCSNITLSGFTAGHTVEPGYCMGGVLDFADCDTVLVEDCGLYGCGILGVQADLCSDIAVKNCDIYECSFGGIRMSDVKGVVVENCTFRDLGGESITLFNCRNAVLNGESIPENYSSGDFTYEY